MMISLSILEYEPELYKHMENLARSEALSKILRLIETGKVHILHIDVMRPPMIPNKTRFSVKLIRRLYEMLHERIPFAIHLMVQNPFPILSEINEFINKKERHKTIVFIQVESFISEEEIVKSIKLLREYGYKAGICLDLPTPQRTLTDRIIEAADIVLLMSVPMGEGGQKYSSEATRRISHLYRRFPNKTIEVDGGINPQTIAIAAKAGVRMAVIGSFITLSKDPTKAIHDLEASLKRTQV